MDLAATWTRYVTEGTSHVDSTLPPAIFSVWTLPAAGFTNQRHARMSSHLHFNMADLRMGGTFSPRKFLDVTPFIDVCAMWVQQNFSIDVSGGNAPPFGATVLGDKIKLSNHYWGVGPKVGLDTLWILGGGVSFYSNFDLSLLYGQFHIKQNETTQVVGVVPPTVLLNVPHNRYYLARLNLDLMIGLRWTYLFQDDAYKITLEAGWEQMILLGQNQLMRFFPSTTTTGNPAPNSSGKGDLTLQGLTMQATFGF
jgi:hypothetical protein